MTIPPNILKILKEESQLKEFIGNMENIEVLFKKLTLNDVDRLNLEYPDFLDIKDNYQEIKRDQKKLKSKNLNIICLTLLKPDTNKYSHLKKIKFYINELSSKIIKILQD